MATRTKEQRTRWNRRWYLRKIGQLPAFVRPTTEEKFWNKVNKTPTCWLWQGVLGGGGYGRIFVEGKMRQAHRYSYILHGGAIPPGFHLDHICRVRHCVNPAHLEPVTPTENKLRGIGITAIEARQKFCKRGHEFTQENTYLTPQGWRRCKTCRIAANNWMPVNAKSNSKDK